MSPSKELFKWDSGHKPPWGNVIGMYQSLHALRGFWPMSSSDENLKMIDMSGQGRVLNRVSTTQNQSTATSALMPYAQFATDRYLWRATEPGLELTGAANMIGVDGQKGITWGCWIRPNEATNATNRGIMAKYTITGNQRGWALITATGVDNIFRANISVDGTAVDNSINATSAFVVDTWHFLVARFTVSTSLDIFVNSEKTSNTTSIIASVFGNNTSPFEIGCYGTGASSTTWSHQQTLCFVCASALSDTVIKALYHHTRALFGV